MGAEPKDQASSPTVTAATQGGWATDVQPSQTPNAAALDAKQQEIIDKINAYLNSFTSLRGTFVQTDAENRVLKGRFYIQRPGKLRFVYDPPSRQVIVSDGQDLFIEDHALKTQQRIPLKATPFYILLKKKVDLATQTQILQVSETEQAISVTVADRTGRAPGRLEMIFSPTDLELKEWVITDVQNLKTRIEIANLSAERRAPPSYFRPSEMMELGDR